MAELLSLVVPVYNIEQYIAVCLESLINQTYKHLEIIIVDDGSTDNTPKIADMYEKKDKRITVIHKKNEGVSIARLTGIKNAKGQYLGFVDGDDFVESDMYEMLMKNAIKYKADISHCGYVMDFPDGHSIFHYNTNKIIVQNNFNGLKDLLEGKFIEPSLVNKIYKIDIIKKLIANRDMDYSIKNLEDLLMNYFLFMEANKSIYEDKCKYHYKLRKFSASTTVRKSQYLDAIKTLKIILKYTDNCDSLNHIVYERYISLLIAIALQNDFVDLKKKSRLSIKNELRNFNKKKLRVKTKLCSIGVVYFYHIFYMIKKVYYCLTGIDKKYKI